MTDCLFCVWGQTQYILLRTINTSQNVLQNTASPTRMNHKNGSSSSLIVSLYVSTVSLRLLEVVKYVWKKLNEEKIHLWIYCL